MDNFTELLILKNKTSKELALKIILAVCSVLFTAVLTFIFVLYNAFLVMIFTPFVIFFLIYFNIIINKMMQIEFEYTLVNGYFDIDKIVGAKKRSRILSLSLNKITEIGLYSEEIESKINENYKIYRPVSGNNTVRLWYFCAHDENDEQCMVIIEPNKKVLIHMNRYIPSKISKGIFENYFDEYED